jgi:hypothetical protein
VSEEDCEGLFLETMEKACPGGDHGCPETSYKMAVAVSKLSPGGEEDPNQCYQESCLTEFLKSNFGGSAGTAFK